MDRRSKLVVSLSLVALATVGIGTWAANAHTQTFQSNLSIHYDKKTGTLWGHVGTASVCQEGRQITIHSSGGGTVGSAVSGHAGMWSGVTVGSGSYYATVSEESGSGYGSDHVCQAGTSSTVSVP
jgi:hypothetical protein